MKNGLFLSYAYQNEGQYFLYIYFSDFIIMNNSKSIKTAEKLCVHVTSISLFIFIPQSTLIMKVRN
jgi:hypothetical protein